MLASGRGKFIIGLTGNIATGKSVVRRMLEHLGAYTIDADALAHRAMRKGAPGYEPVVAAFGDWILDARGEIDRGKLGGLAFQDPAALGRLEAIIYPQVREAVDLLIRRSTSAVIVVEAIKLLEGELRQRCNSIWVTQAPAALQIDRLMADRHMSREDAQQRVAAQGPQTDKIAQANVVIRNTGSYDDLWRQVEDAWQHLPGTGASMISAAPDGRGDTPGIKMGQPEDAPAIAECLNRLSKNEINLTADDVMAQFGQKAYVLLLQNNRYAGVAGWQVDDLIVRTTNLYLESGLDVEKALKMLMREIEAIASDLQCEASLVLPKTPLAVDAAIWERLGYQACTPEELAEQGWTGAATESLPLDTVLLFKHMRSDRAHRPI